MLLIAIAGVVRARRRHRALLALVAHGDPEVPGTLVLDHPAAAAYCVPGVRSQVVVSAGTLELLGPYELAAVLAHERAHARERHDLVLLPFTSLRRIFPQSSIIARTLDAVELLIEMAADDRAGRHRPAKELATALLRFASAGPAPTPAGTLGVIGADETSPVLVRVRRLLAPGRSPARCAARCWSARPSVAVVPLILYAIPGLITRTGSRVRSSVTRRRARAGVRRRPGNHQLAWPSRLISAGTSIRRTTVASTATADGEAEPIT